MIILVIVLQYFLSKTRYKYLLSYLSLVFGLCSLFFLVYNESFWLAAAVLLLRSISISIFFVLLNFLFERLQRKR